MSKSQPDRIILSQAGGGPAQQLELFALLNLGLVQSLASGVLSATEAIRRFYNADNCLYVRKRLRNKAANAIMSHGVQLPDLFDSLSGEEAQREFLRELEAIRALCLRLLERELSLRAVQQAARATAHP